MPSPMEHEVTKFSQDDLEEVSKILFQLNAAIKNSQFYPRGHPRLRESNTILLATVNRQIQERGDVTLRFIENQVVFYKTPLYEISGAISGLVRSFFDRQFQGITFTKGLSLAELTEFVRIMTMSPEELRDRGDIQEQLFSHGISHIAIEKLASSEQGETSDDEERKLSKRLYRRALSELKKAMGSTLAGRNIANIEGIKEVVSDMTDSLSRNRSALLGLTSIKNYDEYTFHHSVNVGILSLGLGSHLSLRKDLLEGLGVGGLLHDIGKILVPERILNKPGKFNDREWSIIRRHPIDGARILRTTRGVSSHAPVVAFEHHIKYDLSGYPSLVRRRPLSSYSLVVGIADCYDAMTTLRPYQKPRTQAEALRIMLESIGRDFEPRLMNRFVEMIGVYPVGSFVRLDTNEFAVVYDTKPGDVERPVVKVVIDAEGQQQPSAKVVDLGDRDPDTGRYRRSIVQALNPTSKGIDIADFL